MAITKIDNLGDAVKHLAARYAFLTVQAKKLADFAKAAKAPINPTTLHAYEKAWKDYRRFGNDVFAELANRDLHVEQILRHGGRPVVDPTNPTGYKTIKVDAPLMPPVFAAMNMGDDDVGAAFLIPLVWALVVLTAVGGIVTYEVLKQYRYTRQGPDYDPDKQVENDNKCAESWMKRGLSAGDAAAHCKLVIAPPPGTSAGHPRSEDSKDLGIGGALLGIGAIAAGAYVVTHLPSKSKAAA